MPIVVAFAYPIALTHLAFGSIAQFLRLLRAVQCGPSRPRFDPHLDEPIAPIGCPKPSAAAGARDGSVMEIE